ISIVNTYAVVGGAAIAAYRLHKGFEELNHHSVMISRKKITNHTGIEPIRLQKSVANFELEMINDIQNKWINLNRTDLTNSLFSLNYPGFDISELKTIRESDIINMHWVSYFQSPDSICKLLDTGKPLVWTLHDQWPFTGGCHYTSGCKGFEDNCINCPQLKNNQYQIAYHTLNRKIELFKNRNITIVTPSKWLANEARKSALFKDKRIEVIPNSLNTNVFVPMDKKEAKRTIGLGNKTITLLFGAQTTKEKRKGVHILVNAIEICKKNSFFQNLVSEKKVRILCFGHAGDELNQLDIPVSSLGFQGDEKRLSELYSAADIFILPSLEDNLPNTMLESMASGTPVIAFATGGMPDLIVNGQTGFLVEPFSAAALAQFILELMINHNLRNQMNNNCRKLILEKFQLKNQAENYIQLFKELLSNSNNSKTQHLVSHTASYCKIEDSGFFSLYRDTAISFMNRLYRKNILFKVDILLKKIMNKIFKWIKR
ncbi:MAG: glycosyltransferase, partial [Spirochaetes bacterium]|nr:glycosyltransferase [Spirochaetota bacterium]